MMKFTLARRLGNPNTDTHEHEKEKDDVKVNNEHNLFNLPPEEKVIDVNEDVKQNENQDSNEIKEDDNMGEILNLERQDDQDVNTNTNINWQQEQENDELLKEKMRNVSNVDENSGNELENKEWQFSDVSVIPRNNKPYKYTLSLNASQLAELINSQKIIYDPSIQRGERITAKGERKPLIFNSNVKTILSKMLDGSMDAGTILLNYAKEYPNELVFNPTERILSGRGALSIVDSAHRLEAIKIWDRKYRKKPDTIKDPHDFYLPVTIFCLSHQEAENLFVEANSKGKPISKTRIAFHDVFNPSRSIAEKLEKSSQLRGKIESISSTIKKSSLAIMTYKTLLDGISSNFKITTNKEAENVSDFLIEYWNELIELFPYSMGNVDIETKSAQRQQSFSIENMWLSSYFVLAQKLYGDPNWKNKLSRLTENDFLSRSNPLWQKIQIDGKIVNRSSTSKFVQEKIIDYVVNGKSIEELMSEK